jgi:hypothetical protein
VTAKGFYRQLLSDINVKDKEITDARTRRDELRSTLVAAVSLYSTGVKSFPSGALAAGTQISPLNDVDVVVTVPDYLGGWFTNPDQAMLHVQTWVEPTITAKFEFTTHAIKLTYPNEDFTADIVVGVEQANGIVIPHCPAGELHGWLPAHPQRHAELVRQRRLPNHTAVFAQQVRILKALNRYWQMSTDDNRKPLASFHVTALALAIFKKGEEVPHDEGTPRFLEAAAQMVMSPLPEPAGVGPALEARNPAEASALLSEAAARTRRALSVSDAEAEAILNGVFGDPEQRRVLLGSDPIGVTDGRFVSVAGAAGAAGAASRAVKPVRSHGE